MTGPLPAGLEFHWAVDRRTGRLVYLPPFYGPLVGLVERWGMQRLWPKMPADTREELA